MPAPQAYGEVQPGMVGATPEDVKAWMTRVMWWAGLAAGLFGPMRGTIVKFLTPLLTSDEFCAALARLLSRKSAGALVSYSEFKTEVFA